MGHKPKGEFFFRCKCGTEWYANRGEVNFTPPCMPYDVYMTCPGCKKPYVFKTKPGDTN